MPYYIINLYNLFISYRKQVLYGLLKEAYENNDQPVASTVFLPLLSKEVLADNNISSSATVISVNSLTQDNLTSSSDVNWYRATLSSAGYISLTFNHDTNNDRRNNWRVSLYDSNIKWLSDYDINGLEMSYIGQNIGVPSGTYYVKVSVSSYSGADYKLCLNYVKNISIANTVDVSSKSLKKGSVFTARKAKYKVTKADVSGLAEVQYKASKNKNYSSAAIPNTVKYKGITYKVTSIADKSFRNNKKLKKVTIGTNVTKIGKEAFLNCKALTKVTIGTGVKTIGASAFQGCVKLTSITIPAKVTKIGKNAFYKDNKLKTIRILTIKLTTKNVGANALKGIYSKATIKVSKKKLKAYKKWLVKKGIGKKVKIKGA